MRQDETHPLTSGVSMKINETFSASVRQLAEGYGLTTVSQVLKVLDSVKPNHKFDCVKVGPRRASQIKRQLPEAKILVIYNKDEFYIHNNVDTLVALQGSSLIAGKEELLKNMSNSGTHIVAKCDSLDVALDAYNQWCQR